MQKRTTVGILIYDDVDLLDYCGPYEVFSAVRLDEARRREVPSPFQTMLVAERHEAIWTNGGMQVMPDVTTADCPALDILLVPGGWGTRREINNQPLLNWIVERSKEVSTLTSVCTGAMLLGKAGLLSGRHATTHWKSLQWMKESFPDVIVEEQLHVVRDGNLFTSAGISAGIDLALMVAAEYYGEEIAHATARHMEYPYPETLERRI